MFFIGVLPALFVLSHPPARARRAPSSSPARARRGRTCSPWWRSHWKLSLYLIVLMTAINFFSHGTGDLYPTFLQKQRGFDTHTTGTLAIVLNVGSIIGAIGFGQFAERIGRRRELRARLPAGDPGDPAVGLFDGRCCRSRPAGS